MGTLRPNPDGSLFFGWLSSHWWNSLLIQLKLKKRKINLWEILHYISWYWLIFGFLGRSTQQRWHPNAGYIQRHHTFNEEDQKEEEMPINHIPESRVERAFLCYVIQHNICRTTGSQQKSKSSCCAQSSSSSTGQNNIKRNLLRSQHTIHICTMILCSD